MRNPCAVVVLASTLLLAAGCRHEAAAGSGDPAPVAATTPGGATASAGAAAGSPGAAGPAPAVAHAAAPAASPAADLDLSKLPAVVAHVNGVAITKQELVERAESMRAQMASMGAPAPPQSEAFYRAMLDQLIGSQLLFVEAKKRGLVPSDAEAAAQLAQLKSRNPEQFAKGLAARGVTEKELAADLAQNLAIQKLINTDVTAAVKVSDETARKFYQDNLQLMKRPAQVRVRHILVNAPQSASADEKKAARGKAEGILARLKGGADFAAVARETSEDNGSKNEGGLLPWLAPGQTVPAFEKAAFALKPNELSGVVESPFGFHILKLEDRRDASTVPFEEARPQIEQLVARQQARDLLEAKVKKLRESAKVEVAF
jgi:peptidyl-prolyl cis-trans isomerase C